MLHRWTSTLVCAAVWAVLYLMYLLEVVRVCLTFGSREQGWQVARGLHLALTAAASPLLRHQML